MKATFIDCPNCGYNFVGVCEAQSGCADPLATVTRSEGLSDLRDQVRSLDALISRLQQDKAKALRRINTLCDKTSHLPSEILSLVFNFALPPIDFRNHLPPWTYEEEPDCLYLRRDTYHREEDYHVKLASVSYRWRQIILSTPHLWTTISLGIWGASTESHISLLDIYCQCAGDLGISIELDFRRHAAWWMEAEDQAREAGLTLLEPIFETVFARIAPKIHHLTLIVPAFEILLKFGKDFSLCSSLAIFGVMPSGWQERPLTNIAELPHLQRVFLHSTNTSIILPWLSITILDLDVVEMSAAFDALAKCLNLIKFRSIAIFSSLEENQNDAEPIEHENLESMICADDVDLYRHFRFTRLRTLHWGFGNIPFHREIDLRLQIFSNLPSTLISLTLDRLSQTQRHHLQDLLLCLPQLLELRLFRCDEESTESAIQSIGRPSRSEAAIVDGPIVLPNLRKLSILTYSEVDSQMVVDMLETLFSVTPSEDFRLELFEVDWHEVALLRLQALVSSGFKVEITTVAEIPGVDSPVYPWW